MVTGMILYSVMQAIGELATLVSYPRPTSQLELIRGAADSHRWLVPPLCHPLPLPIRWIRSWSELLVLLLRTTHSGSSLSATESRQLADRHRVRAVGCRHAGRLLDGPYSGRDNHRRLVRDSISQHVLRPVVRRVRSLDRFHQSCHFPR